MPLKVTRLFLIKEGKSLPKDPSYKQFIYNNGMFICQIQSLTYMDNRF